MVLTRSQKKKIERETIKLRFSFVLNDIKECRPEKILLVCVTPLEAYFPGIHPPLENMPQHVYSCYEGAFRFSGGHLFWPMHKIPYGFTEHAYSIDEFSVYKLKCLWQKKFFLR